MTRLANLGVTFALLGSVLAAPAPAPAPAPASASATEHRINDLVVLDGTVLRFDALHGLDDTTRDTEWQLEYMKSLLSYETEKDLAERSEMLEKRVSNGALCFECMVGTLKLISGDIGTRTFALGVCTTWCANFALNTINANANHYAVELGWDWANGPQTENKYTWINAPRV